MPPIEGEEDAETIYIFDLTLEEARNHFSKTKNYKDTLSYLKLNFQELQKFNPIFEKDINLPTLDEVFELLDRKVLINIEVKTPRDI